MHEGAVLSLSVLLSATLIACAKPTYLTNDSPVTQKVGSVDSCVAHFHTSGICVDVKWEVRPTEDSPGSFIFSTSDGLTSNLRDFDSPLKVVLWMPAMGHGSSPIMVEKVSIGIYRAKEVYFSMKGDWEIRFQNGTDQATYAITL